MRRATAALAVATAVLAAPAAASAKGYAAASVCGANGCHRVDAAAVRTGFDDFTPYPGPDRAERFFTIHLRARVASGRLAEVYALDWLPGSGITRGVDEGLWARPGAVLTAALRRAARGLRPHPATALGAVAGSRPQARVVEVFTPATDDDAGGGMPTTAAIAAAAALIAAAAVAITAGLRRRRAARPPATLAAKTP
jgi:hypothetical protein